VGEVVSVGGKRYQQDDIPPGCNDSFHSEILMKECGKEMKAEDESAQLPEGDDEVGGGEWMFEIDVLKRSSAVGEEYVDEMYMYSRLPLLDLSRCPLQWS
jgi:hypothetical protein